MKKIEITARAKAFGNEGVKRHKFRVDADGTVRVWDSVAGHFTTCHSLSVSDKARIRRLAISRAMELLNDAGEMSGMQGASARITKISTENGITTVDLEWGGPDDHIVEEYDLARLGNVEASGTNGNAGRSGWAILEGYCTLEIGGMIPLYREV